MRQSTCAASTTTSSRSTGASACSSLLQIRRAPSRCADRPTRSCRIRDMVDTTLFEVRPSPSLVSSCPSRRPRADPPARAGHVRRRLPPQGAPRRHQPLDRQAELSGAGLGSGGGGGGRGGSRGGAVGVCIFPLGASCTYSIALASTRSSREGGGRSTGGACTAARAALAGVLLPASSQIPLCRHYELASCSVGTERLVRV